MPRTELAAQLRDQTQVVPTNDLPNPYRRVEPWGDVPTGSYAERASFIGAEEGPDGNLYVSTAAAATRVRTDRSRRS